MAAKPPSVEIVPLAATNPSDIPADFYVGADPEDDELARFLREDARTFEKMQFGITYVARVDERVAGYVTVSCDAIQFDETEIFGLLGRKDAPRSVPGLKIGRLAVDASARAQWAGIGRTLVYYAAQIAVLELAPLAGCRVLTVDSYRASVAFYERLGFVHNGHSIYRKRRHPSMRLDLFGASVPALLSGPPAITRKEPSSSG